MGSVRNFFTALFASIGAFLFGYDSGIIASVLTMRFFVDKFGDDKSRIGAITSTLNGGCFIGAASAGYLNDRLGRKQTIQIGSAFAVWGGAMQCGANNYATMLIGRIIGGIAIGILSMSVPLYNTEIAPHKVRGLMVGLTQQMIGIGFIVANWVGYGTQHIPSHTSWRLPLGLQLVPAALLLFGVFFLPESPRWLLEKDRDEEAYAVIQGLNDGEGDEVYKEMYNTIKADQLLKKSNISELWSTGPMLRRTLVACGVQIFGQFTGINVINYYGPQMYKSLGIDDGDTLLVQGIYGAVGPITNAFFITLILDRVGRKIPLLYGAASFVVTFSILSAIVASFPPTSVETGEANRSAQLAGIAMIFLTSINFSLSFGPVSWVLASEVFPTSVRSIGTSVATCCNWAFNVLFSQVSPLAMDKIGWKFYLIFVILNAIDGIIILFLFPETKGKTLEQMNEVFGDAVDSQKVLHDHNKETASEEIREEHTNPDAKV